MVFIAVVVPQIPQDKKDEFLAAWPTIAGDLKAQPQVLSISAGPIVSVDGKAVDEFKFLQTMAFKNKEDEEAFANGAWLAEYKKKFEDKTAEPHHALFECADLPEGEQTPKAFTQISSITVDDMSKGPELRKAWEDLMALLGKKSWGGLGQGEASTTGVGLVGWDSLEEARAAYTKPEVKAAMDHYHSFGKPKDVLAQLTLC